jgi:two-component system, NarL family, nitrate/nitrite response regulator NarL
MSHCLFERAVLIDDSDIDLFIQRRFLEVYNFANNLIIYKSAEDALAWLKTVSLESTPDLIFLDLNMPEVDGFSFLKRFKDLPESIIRGCKVVVLTSSNSAKDREQAFSYPNVIQFITKPLKQSDLEDLKNLVQ